MSIAARIGLMILWPASLKMDVVVSADAKTEQSVKSFGSCTWSASASWPYASAWRREDAGEDRAETCSSCYECRLPPNCMMMPIPAGDDWILPSFFQAASQKMTLPATRKGSWSGTGCWCCSCCGIISSSFEPCMIALATGNKGHGLHNFLPNKASFLAFQRHHKNVYRLVILIRGDQKQANNELLEKLRDSS